VKIEENLPNEGTRGKMKKQSRVILEMVMMKVVIIHTHS